MPFLYRIKDWNDNFENAKSRTYKACNFVCLPNKHDGEGFNRIMAEPDGMAIFGVWTAIVQLCSRQNKPRDGWLTQTGRRDGAPWDADYLAFRWRRKNSTEIQRTLDFISDPKVGWLEALPVSDSDTTRIPQSSERKKERKKESETDTGTPTPPSSSQGETWRPRLRTILARYAKGANELDLDEWYGLLTTRARVKGEAEIIAFFDWMKSVEHTQGAIIEHARHANRLAVEWNEYAREVVYLTPKREADVPPVEKATA